MTDERYLLTVADLAERLGLTEKQVQSGVRARNMTVIWVGAEAYFHPADIEDWLDGRPQPGTWYFVPDPPAELASEPMGRLHAKPAQRKDGRWTVRLMCGDGVERRFTSRAKEPVQVEHQRKRLRYPINATLRFKVLARDHYTCRYCGRKPPEVALELDHVLAVADGGEDTFENLVTACSECNVGKGARAVPAPHEPAA